MALGMNHSNDNDSKDTAPGFAEQRYAMATQAPSPDSGRPLKR
jgi:hypothetical protein